MDLLVVFMLFVAASLTASKKTLSPYDKKTCSECITAHPKYVWCFNKAPTAEMNFIGPRCQLRNSACLDFESPDEVHIIIRKNKPVRPKRPISPQNVMLDLRRGSRIALPLEVFSQKASVTLKFHYPRAARVEVKSNCTGFKWKNKQATCNGISRGKVQFEVTVLMRRCLSKQKKIKVTVDENRKKSLKIFLKSVCNCNCEKDTIPYSPECNMHGTLACGVCVCDKGYHGTNCECDASVVSPEVSQAMCTPPNNSACSARGTCVCGVCQCDRRLSSGFRYGGRYCEECIDDEGCPRFNGQVCGGPERGICRCRSCQCHQGYEGSNCEQDKSLATDNCISLSGMICNNHGTCINNNCRCQGGYMGRTCDECMTCPGPCDLLKPCVQCSAFKTGNLTQDACATQCDHVETVDSIGGSSGLRMCIFRDEDDCIVRFGYNYEASSRKEIRVERTKTCPMP